MIHPPNQSQRWQVRFSRSVQAHRFAEADLPRWFRTHAAFTLVELLVVIGIIAVLISILLPVLAGASRQAKATACASNLRQLMTAAQLYSTENDFYPPAACNVLATNLHRWHGTRAIDTDPFTPEGGPLSQFLAGGKLSRCPSFEPAAAGYEANAGGYGYNHQYVGSSLSDPRGIAAAIAQNLPGKPSMFRRPAETLAFADTAIGNPLLVEESFLYPPVVSGYPADPSLHFRHNLRANVAWLDGHADGHLMDWTRPRNIYGAMNKPLHLGWFGPMDNTLFDRQ